MGICGEGALGVAWLLKEHGWEVSGCDSVLRPTAREWLEERGIEVLEGHSASHLAGCSAVVYSNAIPASHPELVAAREAGILLVPRGKALAAWVNGIRSVAVCGTHGKTTTSCFTARLLQLAGANPAWCLGGKTTALGSNAGPAEKERGLNSTTLSAQERALCIGVVEADESDATLADETPAISVLTGIDLDHVDHFPDEASLVRCFATLVEQTREALAVCCENDKALQVAAAFKGTCLTYGFSPEAVVRAINLKTNAESTDFDLIYRTQNLGRITLLVPGSHNVLNALGAFSAGVLLGLDPLNLARLLPEAAGELPARRFEWIDREGPVRIVIDYSHHPVELAAAMSIARLQGARRIRVVFQPHRYSRTKALGKDFPKAMREADEVILLPVYAASEKVLEGGEAHDLYAHFRHENPEQKVLLARSLEEAHHYLNITAESGDLIPIVGAGDVVKLGRWFHQGLRLPLEAPPDYALLREALPPGIDLKPRVPIAKWSFYRTGGCADAAVDIHDLPSLSALLMMCSVSHIPTRCIGAGANTWISDLGQTGVAFRLEGEAFKGFSRSGDHITAGAGWSGSAFLNRLEEEGLGGLEFLEGVPGKIGGWVAMNAGAFGGEIWQHIESLRVMTADGQSRCVTASFFRPGYRSVEGLEKLTVVEATFRLTGSDRETIREKRAALREKRKHLAGGQTCGSVFRNPAGAASAGILLDNAGAKNWRIGGASVTPHHANIITTTPTATSSDVLALALKMRRTVLKETGVELSPEVAGLVL